jgi:hypothetical protein
MISISGCGNKDVGFDLFDSFEPLMLKCTREKLRRIPLQEDVLEEDENAVKRGKVFDICNEIDMLEVRC